MRDEGIPAVFSLFKISKSGESWEILGFSSVHLGNSHVTFVTNGFEFSGATLRPSHPHAKGGVAWMGAVARPLGGPATGPVVTWQD